MSKAIINEILLNKMFEGKYLNSNIGHEVINFIKADNGKHYVYVNPYGDVKENEHYFDNGNTSINTILFVRNYGSSKILEVLAKAEDLKPFYNENYKQIKKKWKKVENEIRKKYITSKIPLSDNREYKQERFLNFKVPMQQEIHNYHLTQTENIFYNGKKLNDIFNDNLRNDISLFVTFEAKVSKINQNNRLFIALSCNEKDDKFLEKFSKLGTVIKLDNERFGRDLRKYIKESSNKNCSYKTLLSYINNCDYWTSENNTIKTVSEMIEDKDIDIQECKPNILEIIEQDYDELVHSNLFLHVFKSAPDLFCKFAKLPFEQGGLGIGFDLSPNDISFVREEGNIDLLIDDRKNKSLIVIENKIKSGINGIKYDETGKEVGNQLYKYIRYTYGEKISREKYVDSDKLLYESFSEEELLRKPYNKYVNRKFFIFAPDYKQFDINAINRNMMNMTFSVVNDFYELFEYSKIYKFFSSVRDEYKDKISYYDEFLYAIKKHSYPLDNIKEREMFEQFALKTI